MKHCEGSVALPWCTPTPLPPAGPGGRRQLQYRACLSQHASFRSGSCTCNNVPQHSDPIPSFRSGSFQLVQARSGGSQPDKPCDVRKFGLIPGLSRPNSRRAGGGVGQYLGGLVYIRDGFDEVWTSFDQISAGSAECGHKIGAVLGQLQLMSTKSRQLRSKLSCVVAELG